MPTIRIVNNGFYSTKAQIGDIVNITRFGHIYQCYKQAFYLMQGEKLRLANAKVDDHLWLDISVAFPNLKYEEREEFSTKWRVTDMCLHCNNNKIIYLITKMIKGKRIGLMISEDGVEVIQSTNKIINKLYYKAT